MKPNQFKLNFTGEKMTNRYRKCWIKSNKLSLIALRK